MGKLKFTELGECERCRKEKYICRTGVCSECLVEMKNLRGDEKGIRKRIKELNTSENSIVRSLRGTVHLQTLQRTPEIKPRFERLDREQARGIKSANISLAKVQALLNASPQELANARQDDFVRPELIEINRELMSWLGKHPEQMRQLSPRKFEEVVAEIFRDQGHEVQLTQATRDGGRDIIVVMKTPIGKLLSIVECKRWSPPNKVGIAIVERFLHVVREKEKANVGIIVTTTFFTADAKKSANEFEYLLKLEDFERLHQMTLHYGSWHQNKGSKIWMPDYAAM